MGLGGVFVEGLPVAGPERRIVVANQAGNLVACGFAMNSDIVV